MKKLFLLLLIISCRKVENSNLETLDPVVVSGIAMNFGGSPDPRGLCVDTDRNVYLMGSAINASITVNGENQGSTGPGRGAFIIKFNSALKTFQSKIFKSETTGGRSHFNFCTSDLQTDESISFTGYVHDQVSLNGKSFYSTNLSSTYYNPLLVSLDRNFQLKNHAIFESRYPVVSLAGGQMMSVYPEKNGQVILGQLENFPNNYDFPDKVSGVDVFFGEFNYETEKFNWTLPITGNGSDSGQHAPILKTKDGGWLINLVSNSAQVNIGNQSITRPSYIPSDLFVNYLVKLNKDRKIEWHYAFNNQTTIVNQLRDIIELNDGYVFVMQSSSGSPTIDGITYTTKGSIDVWLVKVNLQGTTAWVKHFGSTGSEASSHNPLTKDNKGNIFLSVMYGGTPLAPSELVGTTLSSGGSSNYFLFKINSQGEIVASKRIDSTAASTVGNLEYINDHLYHHGRYIGVVRIGDFTSANFASYTSLLLKIRW